MNKKSIVVVSVFSIIFILMLSLLWTDHTPSEKEISDRFENSNYTVSCTEYKDKKVMLCYKGMIVVKVTWYKDNQTANAEFVKNIKIVGNNNVAKRGNAVAVGEPKSVKIFAKLF